MKAQAVRTASVPPIRQEILVKAPQAHVFRVFTEQMDAWWPQSHKIGKAPLKRAMLEGRAGGRWYEIDEDGSECNWGKVLVWEPPRRLVLAWQITATWQYDASFVTEVEVTFAGQGPNATQVVLEHRNLERYGEAAPEVRKSIGSANGWLAILEGFGKVAAA